HRRSSIPLFPYTTLFRSAMQTTSKVLNVPIKYYISMNMGGMRKIVDGVGGVTVTRPLTFTYDGYTFTKGKTVHLNGNQALAYSRSEEHTSELQSRFDLVC